LTNRRKHLSSYSKQGTNALQVCWDSQKTKGLSAATFKAIGALSSVLLGWFSWEKKNYEPSVTLDEQVELIA